MATVDIITICRNTTHLPYKYRSSDKFSFTHFPHTKKIKLKKKKKHTINLNTVLLSLFPTGKNIDRNQILQL